MNLFKSTEKDTQRSSTERPVQSPPCGFGGPPSPNYSPNTILNSHGKRLEETGPSKKRFRSPSYDEVDAKYEIMNLRKTTDDLIRHIARIDVQIKKLMEENAELKKEIKLVKYESDRNARWGKQSLSYLREDVDLRLKMEENRVNNQLSMRDYKYHVINNGVSNLYDNLEFLHGKQKAKNEKVEKFMKKVEDEKKKYEDYFNLNIS